MSAATPDPWLALAGGRWRALWCGDLPLSALTQVDATDRRADLDEADLRGVAATLARHEAAGRVLLRDAAGALPPLYRLEDFHAEGARLELWLGRTDYGEYLHTNVAQPERRAARGDAAMSDALALAAVLVTSDGHVAYGPRSPRIGDGSGPGPPRVHVLPSGHPEPPADVADGLFAELEEEAGVARDEVEVARMTGLVRAVPSGKPELTFLLHVRCDRAELSARRARGVVDAWEFTALEFFPWSAAGARAWLTEHAEDAVAPGHAAVALAARAAFPDASPPSAGRLTG